MTMAKVNNSWIVELTYNRNKKVMTMVVAGVRDDRTDDRTYLIHNISRRKFDAWRKAESKGVFYNAFVRNKYRIHGG